MMARPRRPGVLFRVGTGLVPVNSVVARCSAAAAAAFFSRNRKGFAMIASASNVTTQPAPGGQLQAGPHYTQGALRGSRFPSGASLERGEIAQTLIDVAAVGVAIVLVLATGVSIAASLFILFFVQF